MDNQLPDQNEPSATDLDNKPTTEPATVAPTEPTVAPEASYTPTPPTAPVVPPKNSHIRRNIMLIVAVLLLAVLAAAWLFIRPNYNNTQATKTPAVVKPTDSAQAIVGKINTAITSQPTKDYQPPAVTLSTPLTNPSVVSPSYKVQDASYYVTTTRTYGLTATSSTKSSGTAADQTFVQGVTDQAAATLTANHYVKTETLVYGTEYQSNDVICLVSLPSGPPVSVTCANKSDYTAVSEAVKPFAAAYVASANAGNASQSGDVFSLPIVKNSSVAGYQNATLSISSHQGISGASLMFYQHNNAGWQFFLATQNSLNCSQFTTADEQAAFADEKCIDSNDQETTVAASQAAPQKQTVNPIHNTSQ